jgi:hypothetical protein
MIWQGSIDPGARQQHRIPVAEKPVLLRNGVAVQTHDVFVTRKGAGWTVFPVVDVMSFV